jgi:hypothetical protein
VIYAIFGDGMNEGNALSGFFVGGPFLAFTGLLRDVGLAPDVLFVAAICAGLGALVLSRHTFQLGTLTYPINFLVLFAGAVMANLLMSEVRLPFGLSAERTVVISIAGMIVVSLIVLLVLPRDRESG